MGGGDYYDENWAESELAKAQAAGMNPFSGEPVRDVPESAVLKGLLNSAEMEDRLAAAQQPPRGAVLELLAAQLQHARPADALVRAEPRKAEVGEACGGRVGHTSRGNAS